jgi:hypothetical protein
MGAFMDMTGREFTRLRVVGFGGWAGNGNARLSAWRCVCAEDLGGCGRETVVRVSKLKNGHTKSCGCLRDDSRGKSSITHGASRGKTRTNKMSPEYTTWAAMRQRCLTPTCKKFPRYGGRGIRICDRWQDFAAFLADMGPKPSSKHTVERINNDGDYEPANCRWATNTEQSRNRSSNTILELDGVRRCLAEWVEITGIRLTTIQQRKRAGWSDRDALTVAPSHGNRHLRLAVAA